MISANPELDPVEDELELEPPRLPAVTLEALPADELEELLAALDDDREVTGSPGDRLSNDTIVPLIGA